MHPRDDFDAEIKAVLDREAERAPHVDLATAALKQAGRIRARRRITAGVGVAAVAALVIPIGVNVLDSNDQRPTANQPTDTSPTQTALPPAPAKPVQVKLAALARGADPAVPYINGDQFISKDGQATTIEEHGRVLDAAQLVDGIGVWTGENDLTMTFSSNGAATSLPTDQAVTSPAIDPANGYTAWAGGDTFYYTGSLDGEPKTVSAGALHVTSVLGVSQGVATFNARDANGGSVVGDVDLANGGEPVLRDPKAIRSIAAVSPDRTLLSAVTGDMSQGEGMRCAAVVSYDEPTDQKWRSCKWRPLEFSPDSTRVLANENGDGFGPRYITILDAQSGQVLQTFTTPGTFVQATFEDNDTILFLDLEGTSAALVRCSLAGACERATDTKQVEQDDPDSFYKPYRITAN